MTDSSDRQATEKFVLRLPRGMRSEIAEISKKQRRSMNAQIIFLLERLIKEDALENRKTIRQEQTVEES